MVSVWDGFSIHGCNFWHNAGASGAPGEQQSLNISTE